MKALSLWQPWASLLVHGEKEIETRSWATKYRGPLMIHAARRSPVESANMRIQIAIDNILGRHIWELPRGGIIGMVNLVDCIEIKIHNRPSEPERSYGDYTPGRYMWITENQIAFKKIIPYRGMQGLFTVPEEACEA